MNIRSDLPLVRRSLALAVAGTIALPAGAAPAADGGAPPSGFAASVRALDAIALREALRERALRGDAADEGDLTAAQQAGSSPLRRVALASCTTRASILHSHREFCSRYAREVLAEATGDTVGEVETFAHLLASRPMRTRRSGRSGTSVASPGNARRHAGQPVAQPGGSTRVRRDRHGGLRLGGRAAGGSGTSRQASSTPRRRSVPFRGGPSRRAGWTNPHNLRHSRLTEGALMKARWALGRGGGCAACMQAAHAARPTYRCVGEKGNVVFSGSAVPGRRRSRASSGGSAVCVDGAAKARRGAPGTAIPAALSRRRHASCGLAGRPARSRRTDSPRGATPLGPQA